MTFDPKYTYLLLDAVTFLFPLALSFDKKVAFYKYWWRLFPAIVISGALFIVWDHFFTVANNTFTAAGQQWSGIWNFNPEYLTGIYWLHLPIEEWLFFLVVPYACVFIYEVLNAYWPKPPLTMATPYLNGMVLGGSLIAALLAWGKWYPMVTFLGLAALMAIVLLLNVNYMGRFYRMYVVHLIPFYTINGVLTGLPVVVYNNSENFGVRVFTVPIEDGFYSMLLLLLNITLYEYLYRTRYRQPRFAR